MSSNKIKHVCSCMLILYFIFQDQSSIAQSQINEEYGIKIESVKITANLTDDLNFVLLKEAVSKSISYFKKQDPGSTIYFNGKTYSYSQLITSYTLFIDIIEKYADKKLIKNLSNNYILYKVVSPVSLLFTAYYEVTISGSTVKTENYNAAVYARPTDLILADLNDFSGIDRTVVGKVYNKTFIPYDNRESIVSKESLKGRAEIICYVNNVDLFFMQIEGSGGITFRNEKSIRVTADVSNGHGFVSIPKYFGENVPQGAFELKTYLKNNPRKADLIMNKNPRYVFFKIAKAGPEGNIGEVLTAGRSIAADNSFYPKGLIAYTKTYGENPINRFTVIQDAGSVISGSDRIDVFFGNDDEASSSAEKFRQYGEFYILLPLKSK